MMKIVRKWGAVLFCCFAGAILLSGCRDVHYTQDTAKKYQNYLELAFGDYQCSEPQEVRNSGMFGNDTYVNWYDLTYHDNSGQEHTFSFDNQSSFKWWVMQHASKRAVPEVEAVLEQDFPGITKAEDKLVNFWLTSPQKNGSSKMVEAKKWFFFEGDGLRFQDFDIADLAKYQLGFHLVISYHIEGLDQPYGTPEEFREQVLQTLARLARQNGQEGLLSGRIFVEQDGEYVIAEELSWDAGNEQLISETYE